jgi:hypothetical protein
VAALRVVAALVLAATAALAVAVFVAARRVKRRHRAVLGAPLPSLDPKAERLVDAPRALYHGTRFADGVALLDPALGSSCVADLWCTAQALFLRRERGASAPGQLLALPLAWVDEAVLLRAPAELAKRELPMLRLRWRRGGERLETSVSLRGGLPELEKLRREIHLRQGQGELTSQLKQWLEQKPPEPGK